MTISTAQVTSEDEVSFGAELKKISARMRADRQQLVRKLFDTAARYRHLADRISLPELKAFLADECLIPQSQLASYIRLNEYSADERTVFEDKCVAPDVILALTTVRVDVRREAMSLIRSGRNLQTSELRKIRRDIDLGAILRAEGSDPSHRNALKSLAKNLAARKADELVTDLRHFADEFSDLIYAEKIERTDVGAQSRLQDAAGQAKKLRARINVYQPFDKLQGFSRDAWTNVELCLERFENGEIAVIPEYDPYGAEQRAADRASFIKPEPALLDWIRAALGDLDVYEGFPLRSTMVRDGRVPVLPEEDSRAHVGLTVVELCAGAGGQAIGLHSAGFRHVALIEQDVDACATISLNQKHWRVIQEDMREVDYSQFGRVDLVAGGVPCQPFSATGARKGKDDERDLFSAALDVVEKVRPRAVMLENVEGVSFARHLPYRLSITGRLRSLGYDVEWRSIYGPELKISQTRRRMILVALERGTMHRFRWPTALDRAPAPIGELIGEQMGANGWKHAEAWAKAARGHAPTVIGGSSKKTNTDLAQPKSRQAWHDLGIDPRRVKIDPPGEECGPSDVPSSEADIDTFPALSLRMLATIQGFPLTWKFAPARQSNRLTGVYDCNGDMPADNRQTIFRQIANAFPPHMAKAIAVSIKRALTGYGTDLNVSMHERLLPLIDLTRSQPTDAEIEADPEYWGYSISKREIPQAASEPAPA